MIDAPSQIPDRIRWGLRSRGREHPGHQQNPGRTPSGVRFWLTRQNALALSPGASGYPDPWLTSGQTSQSLRAARSERTLAARPLFAMRLRWPLHLGVLRHARSMCPLSPHSTGPRLPPYGRGELTLPRPGEIGKCFRDRRRALGSAVPTLRVRQSSMGRGCSVRVSRGRMRRILLNYKLQRSTECASAYLKPPLPEKPFAST
jgi:hypothetical protein